MSLGVARMLSDVASSLQVNEIEEAIVVVQHQIVDVSRAVDVESSALVDRQDFSSRPQPEEGVHQH